MDKRIDTRSDNLRRLIEVVIDLLILKKDINRTESISYIAEKLDIKPRQIYRWLDEENGDIPPKLGQVFKTLNAIRDEIKAKEKYNLQQGRASSDKTATTMEDSEVEDIKALIYRLEGRIIEKFDQLEKRIQALEGKNLIRHKL